MSVIELTYNGNRLVIVSIYGPSGNIRKQFFEALKRFLDYIKPEMYKKKTIVCGDFNIDILKDSPEKYKLLDILCSYGFDYYVKEPSRVTEFSAKAIDNMVTNFVPNTHSISVFETGLSDHYCQLLQFPLEPVNVEPVKYVFVRSVTDDR